MVRGRGKRWEREREREGREGGLFIVAVAE